MNIPPTNILALSVCLLTSGNLITNLDKTMVNSESDSIFMLSIQQNENEI